MDFYTCNLILSFFALLICFMFRFGVDDYLRYTKNSKTYIRKSKKGFVNFWFYKRMHSEKRMGYVFYLNILLLGLTPAYVLLAVSCGWIEIMQIPVSILSIALCIVQVPSIIFSNIYLSLEAYGVKLVLLKKFSSRGFYSSLYIIIEICGIVAFTGYNFLLALRS